MFQILSESEKKLIHKNAKQILAEVGIRVRSKKIYDLMLEAGAAPDREDAVRLYIPEEMVLKYLALCPRDFEITDRKGNKTLIRAGGEAVYYTANATQYQRGTSHTVTPVGIDEFTALVRVADKLDNVGGIVGTSIREYPPHGRDFAGFRIAATHSFKHLRPCIYTPSGAEAIIEMADVILDGKPLKENMFFTLGYSIVSPLTWSETALELFYRTRGHGIPMMINSEPLAGGTSPVTLAGSLAMADAEVLSGIIINQVIEPGRPCIYNSGFAHVFDMMTTLVLTGSPENALLQGAGAEMAQFNGFPSASWALSDAPVLDSQASFEKMLTGFVHTLTGVNMIWGVGNIETSKTISPEIAVIDNEIIGNCKRFARRFTVDDEHLALDLIRETAFGGSFLESAHTLEHFMEEIRYSDLLNRVNRNGWESGGSVTVDARAAQIVDDILAREPDIYLTGSQMEKLNKIEKSWLERLSV